MTADSFLIVAATCALAGVVSVGVLWLIGRAFPGQGPRAGADPALGGTSSFLFRDELLADHDAGALPPAEADPMAWSDLQEWLASRFTGLPARLDDLPEGQVAVFRPGGPEAGARLELRRRGRTTRVILSDPPHVCPAERHALLCARARQAEIDDAFQTSPHPIWKTALDGALLWHNPAAEGMAARCAQPTGPDLPEEGSATTRRVSIPGPDPARPLWYEVHSRVAHSTVMHHATDITKVIRAESAQREFVQTLTKTFAYLTIGLAVFDRKRQLALFNPALIDLTSLPADFLSGRPDLMTFFDNLRDRQVMPEPRSYSSWRAQINQVVASAQDGLYQETWSLPNDVTYRVTGRPHPDGAVAFLFEDISAEILMARRHRTQLDLRQAAMDALPHAVMVIGPDNVLSFCNTAATRLLGIDPDCRFADMSVNDLLDACTAALPASGSWATVEATLKRRGPITPVSLERRTAHGAPLQIRVEPLPGGARMLALRTDSAPAAALPEPA